MDGEIITPYLELLTTFVAGTVDARTFERDYIYLFKNEKTIFATGVFGVLDKLFADVDAFCPDAELRDEDDLTEQQLRESARQSLEKLKAWCRSPEPFNNRGEGYASHHE